ncbi:porin [Marinospirillum sp.]|uniref:porin n=1 Tax=Marinospirillum sp. TaxID=2183934 RepID=UPI0028706869|nr:porin [Marinospirillum sp.]MDR9469069.1 porin [Marinospirillum sp.]
MKKTLLAVSLSALAAGSANAAVTLNETETGSFSTYGKIVLQLNNYDGENEIQNNGSRFGFSGESQINDDINAFANAEFRFNAGVKNNGLPDDSGDTQGTFQVRYSYVGVEGGFGKVTAGNFDSVYYTAVGSNADIMEQDGWRSVEGAAFDYNGDGNDQAVGKGEGFSLAYETVDLGGFKGYVGLRHYNSADSRNGAGYPAASATGDEVWNVQLAGTYALNDLTLGLAFDQNNEDIYLAKNTVAATEVDPIIAASVNYSTDAFGAFAVYEATGDLMVINLGGSFNYGAGDVYGLISHADYSPSGSTGVDGMDISVGANYSLSDNFYLFGEFAQGNDDLSGIQQKNNLGVDKGVASITLGANYNW